MAIWTMTVPVISTAHTKKETAEKLEFGEDSGYCVFTLCDGFMLYEAMPLKQKRTSLKKKKISML